MIEIWLIADYNNILYKVNLISGKNFLASGEKSIFNSAKESGIVFEHSCLNGRCSSCKGKVIKGETQKLGFEFGLTEEEKREGYILTCINAASSDLEIEIEDLGNVNFFPVRIIPAKINSLEQVLEDVILLKIRMPSNTGFEFISGQYVNLIYKNIKRSYSIAGIDENCIKFYIKKYEQGLFSNYLFNHAKVNDMLRFEGPFGSFFLRENSLESIVFLATGTGIAPILAILNDPMNKSILSSRKVSLFYGGRTYSDLEPFNFLKDLGIQYFPVLSREEIKGFDFGYVHEAVLNKLINLNSSSVYACGSSVMIRDAKNKLVSSGLKETEFYSDEFVVTNFSK